jgi:uncharacterized LabA/DUF88 family protein
LKIAVFVDFDNIEIGVKTTLGQQFDIAAILEAIKERGEVITKVAYGDWKRAGDYGRQLSQHAIRMVQRNLTPGGDKNGADINLALDALEMAFTHDHINAFVIVGGDSDFITLVEKLKQYDKKVFVVGGRQFTSLVMQKNCHEFIAYENLVSSGRRSSSSSSERRSQPAAASDVSKALPLVKRALKVLVDREVTPQLGLLKSTLLQLDSTFSERDYGASTFRDFIEKVAQTGLVTLRHSGRSLLVDLAETSPAAPAGDETAPAESEPAAAAAADVSSGNGVPADGNGHHEEPPAAAEPAAAASAPEGIERIRSMFANASPQPRWPMYVRQVKQYIRSHDEGFDERKYGFATIVDFLRAAQREGVFRIERDRQGVMRVFPGNGMQKQAAVTPPIEITPEAIEAAVQEQDHAAASIDETGHAEQPAAVETVPYETAEFAVTLDAEPAAAEAPAEAAAQADVQAPSGPVLRAEDGYDLETHQPGNVAGRGEPAAPRTVRRTRKAAAPRATTRKTAGTKTAARPRAPRRKTTE